MFTKFRYPQAVRPLHPWAQLAQRHGLEYDPRFTLFDHLGEGSRVWGLYRGYNLLLILMPGKYEETRVIVSGNQLDFSHIPVPERSNQPLTVDELMNLLAPAGLPVPLRGRLETSPGGRTVRYRQEGREEELAYLQQIFDLVCDIAIGYAEVVASGGIAVPALAQLVISRHPLRLVAERCLRTISWETKQRLGGRVTTLLCPYCLAHCQTHRVKLLWWQGASYCGCRQCGQSREFLELTGRVVAVLDSKAREAVTNQEGELRVNWLAWFELFDFDTVEIIQASDEEVERFVVKLGNDTDPVRRARYRQMVCRVASRSDLSANTIRILEKYFKQVEMTF